MLDPKQYRNGTAFRAALEQRIRELALKEGTRVDDLHRQVAFDRLLARLDFRRYTLRGGYSLEIRMPKQKRTTDIDVSVNDKKFAITDPAAQQEGLLEDLRAETHQDFGDYFSFEVERATKRLASPKAGGFRFYIIANVNNREFHKFHVDVSVQTNPILPPEKVTLPNKLAFSDSQGKMIMVAPKEEVFAEKLCAYLQDRGTVVNSRVRDLADMAILIEENLDLETLKKAVNAVFSERHVILPVVLPAPPTTWHDKFTHIAKDRDLNMDLDKAFERLALYYKVLV